MAAARPEYATAMGKPHSLVLSLLVGGALTAFSAKTGLFKAVLPFKAKVIGVRLTVGQKGGTHVTSALDVLAGGVSLLAAVFDVDAAVAGTPIDKEIADLAAGAAAVAANSEITINTTESGGTSPTWADVMVQIDFVPL